MDGTFQALTLADIVEVNRRAIESGGSFYEGDLNLAHRGSLEYILGAIEGPVYGHDLYPTIIQKAAALSWSIIGRHVFHDGNKRTGALVCAIFLELNGYNMSVATAPNVDEELVNVTEAVASGAMELEEWTRWVESRTVKMVGSCLK
jgi:death-on-curing protein